MNLKQIRRRMFWGEVLSVASLVLCGAFVIVPIALSQSHPGLGLLIGLAGLVPCVFPLRRSGGSLCRGTELLCCLWIASGTLLCACVLLMRLRAG
jgi:hypothetical protein